MSVNPALRAVRTSTRAVLASSLAIASIVAVPVLGVSAQAATASAAEAPAVLPGTRDPLTWPFARDSIWNSPVGSTAKYTPAGIATANAWRGEITVDPEYISMNRADPLKTLSTGGQAGHGARVRVPVDMAHDGSWNGCATLLAEDGRTAYSGQPLKLTAGGNPSWPYTVQRTGTDLRGAGVEGCHGGSGMSGIGGSLRVGELASSAPLRHALKVNLFCKKYCWKGTSMADSKRWPALAADSYWASGYAGRVPAVRMGALLALPPTVDLSQFTDPKAKKLATAFRDYGAYLVDDTAWDVHGISVDQRMLTSGEWPSGAQTTFHAQVQKLFTQLSVVDNNTAASVGGGGTPRAPLAPCFADDVACLGTAVTASPTVAPAPAPTTPTTVVAPPSTVTPATDGPLSALAPSSSSSAWGPVERNRSNGEQAAGDGRVLTIGGKTYSTGLGVHARSDITYALDGKYAHFTTDVGIDDEAGSAGSAVFEVYVDGVLKTRTAKLTGSQGPTALSLSVYGAKTLRLVATDGGDGNAFDHADWAGAMLWAMK